LKIEEQRIVFEKDYRKLRALFHGSIMLYLKKESVRIIMANLITIGRYVGIGNENSRLCEELRAPVLTIINLLLRDMGFDGKLNKNVIQELEKAEDDFFPRLFMQAIKEALDNFLVNHSDYCLLNRGENMYGKKTANIFSFINDHPHGCKIMIGPFNNEAGVEIILHCIFRVIFKLRFRRFLQITAMLTAL
jgi:hypothetical protein